MSDSNYIKVYTGSLFITQRLVDELAKSDINAIVKDESESARLAGFGASIQGEQELFVNKDEQETAEQIIQTVLSQLEA
ncbi:DUF2007 domain-containing protein [Formosa sp. S-31]|uniref:DUF2007 domain-containing protein n=1 Tax=Formosa sp. S-31 TaxID=2790949 RepID=UPI003EB9815C